MAMLCKSSVLNVYKDIMEDVIDGVKELFAEDGVDEQVLQELKQTWETKLLASKAVDSNSNDQDIKPGAKKTGDVTNGSTNGFPKHQPQILKQVIGQVPPNNHVQTGFTQVSDSKMVPIQITLPTQPGSEITQRVLTIQVPAAALQGNQLHKILTGPIISATMNLPHGVASSLLQQHVNSAFSSSQTPGGNKSVTQTDGSMNCDSSDEENIPASPLLISKNKAFNRKLFSGDAPPDTSDEEEEASEEEEISEEIEDEKEEEEAEQDDGGQEEEPLNSEDDVTDEDPMDLFDTENVVVCQYDKISRSRNKWKFHLKDGIMSLNGEDFIFQKANGDAEW